jgi:hypothetical protein
MPASLHHRLAFHPQGSLTSVSSAFSCLRTGYREIKQCIGRFLRVPKTARRGCEEEGKKHHCDGGLAAEDEQPYLDLQMDSP